MYTADNDTDIISHVQGDDAASNVIQTPTCPEAAEAEAELTVAKSRPSLSALRQSFSRRGHKSRQSVEFAAVEPAPRQKSFAGVCHLLSVSRFQTHSAQHVMVRRQ